MNEKIKLAILSSSSFILCLAFVFILFCSDMSGDIILPIICITALYVLSMFGLVFKFRNKLKPKIFLTLMFAFDFIYAALFVYFAFC